jgi:hypothetical protein
MCSPGIDRTLDHLIQPQRSVKGQNTK